MSSATADSTVECTYEHPVGRLTGTLHFQRLERKIKDLESLLHDSAVHVQSEVGHGSTGNLRDTSADSGLHENGTTPVMHTSSSTPAHRPLEDEEDRLETMIDGKSYTVRNRDNASTFRGPFAGLNILQRIRNLCDRLSGDRGTDESGSSEDDLADAFDISLVASMPLDHLDDLGLARLPAKDVTLARVRIALDQACCLMQFMHRSVVESLVHRVYDTELDMYAREDRKQLALVYSLCALGMQFEADNCEDAQDGRPQLRG